VIGRIEDVNRDHGGDGSFDMLRKEKIQKAVSAVWTLTIAMRHNSQS